MSTKYPIQHRRLKDTIKRIPSEKSLHSFPFGNSLLRLNCLWLQDISEVQWLHYQLLFSSVPGSSICALLSTIQLILRYSYFSFQTFWYRIDADTTACSNSEIYHSQNDTFCKLSINHYLLWRWELLCNIMELHSKVFYWIFLLCYNVIFWHFCTHIVFCQILIG